MLPPWLALLILIAPGLGLGAAGPAPGPVRFDAHLHYDAPMAEGLPPAAVLDLFDRHGIEAAAVTARPPGLVLDLHRQAPDRIAPILGVYRTAADKEAWHRDPDLPGRVRAALETGPWRAIGELHLFAPDRGSAVFLEVVRIAVEWGLPLLVHADPAVIDSLFEHAPRARVIWAHGGAYPYPPLLADYLARYPNLYADLSVREDRIAPGGDLDPAWWTLLTSHPDRFLVGVDTYSAGRWARFGQIAEAIRGWLEQLPPEVADAIARGNARRLFGLGP
jgi:hypothetical protein